MIHSICTKFLPSSQLADAQAIEGNTGQNL